MQSTDKRLPLGIGLVCILKVAAGILPAESA
jgi:hypothetical protein